MPVYPELNHPENSPLFLLPVLYFACTNFACM